MKVVLVSVGNFQEYILDNIHQLQRFHNHDIVVITNRTFFNKLEQAQVKLVACEDLEINPSLHHEFPPSLRFFYLHSYMKNYCIANIVHLENDVLCFENLDTLASKFTESKIYATFDCETRVIPGFVFIPHATSLEPILNNYHFHQNDMENFGRFQEDVIVPLPICTREVLHSKVTKEFDHFQCIFDAAAMGQYLGGVDPRNIPGDTRGFINETCVIQYHHYPFHWITNAEGLQQPFLEVHGKIIQIINLHIHSKQLHLYTGII